MKFNIAAALFSLFAFNAAHATIITNGNFEQGTAGWTTYGDAELASHSASGFYNGAGTVAQDGVRAIVFNNDLFPVTGGLAARSRAGTGFAGAAGPGSAGCGRCPAPQGSLNLPAICNTTRGSHCLSL